MAKGRKLVPAQLQLPQGWVGLCRRQTVLRQPSAGIKNEEPERQRERKNRDLTKVNLRRLWSTFGGVGSFSVTSFPPENFTAKALRPREKSQH